ncbi:unnamed protein product [Linum trigynum]|uniref:Uncharacterized protein n=1 Tax=Linum trigynum TaxID=586398 RepID=A0AAV2EE96_9ROSI
MIAPTLDSPPQSSGGSWRKISGWICPIRRVSSGSRSTCSWNRSSRSRQSMSQAAMKTKEKGAPQMMEIGGERGR